MIESSAKVRVELVEAPIRLDPLMADLEDPATGAVAIFLGRVRNLHEGRAVRSIHYQAYAEMAGPVLGEIAAEIVARFPVSRVVLLHRVGHLGLGEASVLVAVASPHRADAFEACRLGIERIKQDVPVWKKEVLADGTEEWVDARVG